MKRKILLILLLSVLLSGCGQRREPDVEHFQGDVVATLQKSASQEVVDSVELTPQPSEAPLPSPQASETLPTLESASTPASTVSIPQSTAYPPNVQTNTPPQAAYPTEDLTQTPALVVSDWEGVWKIWYQNTRGGYTPAELSVQINGTSLMGTATIEGMVFSFEGDLSGGDDQVGGEWQTDSDEGSFWWRMDSPDTFVGSRDNRFGMCGNRATESQPNPCREIPPN